MSGAVVHDGAAAELPPALVPSCVDLRSYPRMPLAIQRLLESDFSALASAAEWRAGVTLWMRSWQEVPAGSLPADDLLLAKKAGVTLREWERIKPMALRGWVRCADGRLYHRVVAELVIEAWLDKLSARGRSALGHETRWGVPGQSEADLIEHMRQEAREALARLAPTHAIFSRKGRVAGGAGGRKARPAAGAPPGPAGPPGGAVAGAGSGGAGAVGGPGLARGAAAAPAVGGAVPVRAVAHSAPAAPAAPSAPSAPYAPRRAAAPAAAQPVALAQALAQVLGGPPPQAMASPAAGAGRGYTVSAGPPGGPPHAPVPMPGPVLELLGRLRPGGALPH